MTIEDAIKISKILAGAPEERLPMILSVLEKADVVISGLEELEEWKIFKDMAEIIDIENFVREIFEAFGDFAWTSPDDTGAEWLRIPATEFSAYCKRKRLRPTPTKRALARKGCLRISQTAEKTEYTAPALIDGRTVRCVFIRKGGADHDHI